MRASQFGRFIVRLLGSGAVVALAGYASYVAVAWCRYGRPNSALAKESDPLLDRFMPVYEAVERNRVRVAAPADVTFSAACDMDFQQSKTIRAIFKTRELILGSKQPENVLPRGLVAQVKALGWGVLAEVPEREIVMGAVTRPWETNVVFRALAPGNFASFHEAGYVKIVWTLRADPIGAGQSVFRTETRVATTDAEARRKFRLYWSFFSPGIILIRHISLGPLKTEAESRAQHARYIGEQLEPRTTTR